MCGVASVGVAAGVFALGEAFTTGVAGLGVTGFSCWKTSGQSYEQTYNLRSSHSLQPDLNRTRHDCRLGGDDRVYFHTVPSFMSFSWKH